VNSIDKDRKVADNDTEIARQFAQMRAREAASAPAFDQRLAAGTARLKPKHKP